MELVFKGRDGQALETGVNFDQCLICQKTSSKPLRELTAHGLPNLKSCLLVCKDDVYERHVPFLDNNEEFLVRKPKCHKDYKSVYTGRNKLEKLAKKGLCHCVIACQKMFLQVAILHAFILPHQQMPKHAASSVTNSVTVKATSISFL